LSRSRSSLEQSQSQDEDGDRSNNVGRSVRRSERSSRWTISRSINSGQIVALSGIWIIGSQDHKLAEGFLSLSLQRAIVICSRIIWHFDVDVVSGSDPDDDGVDDGIELKRRQCKASASSGVIGPRAESLDNFSDQHSEVSFGNDLSDDISDSSNWYASGSVSGENADLSRSTKCGTNRSRIGSA